MATSVLLACGLNEQKLPPYVHISEESEVDGSFLISCILGQRLRISNAGTLLVCLQHPYQHYFNVGMRLGYNSNIFLGKTLNVIDPLSKICFNCQLPDWATYSDTNLTDKILADIRSELQVNYTNRIHTTVLVDNISILVNLGESEALVQQFCKSLSELTNEFENLTIITKISNSEVYKFLDNNAAKLGDLRINVLKLESGIFREADGRLLVERIGEQGSYMSEKTRKEVIFKVTDRNIKIFNPGETGLKV